MGWMNFRTRAMCATLHVLSIAENCQSALLFAIVLSVLDREILWQALSNLASVFQFSILYLLKVY